MKKMFMALLGAGLLATAVFAEGDDTPIQLHQLPGAAREFVKKYFRDVQVAGAVTKSGVAPAYEVTFVDGSEVGFDSRGEWTEIERPRSVVPEELVPPQILKFVAANHPGNRVSGIERDGRSYDVELDNGLLLKFNRKFRLIGMDD